MECIVFILGGTFYGLTEFLYRGYTHWTMVLTGGAVILTFYWLTPLLLQQMNLPLAAFTGAVIITAYEFAVGCTVNLWLNWEVWDYSSKPGNVLGQICPLYSGFWFVLCLAFFSLIKYNKGILF